MSYCAASVCDLCDSDRLIKMSEFREERGDYQGAAVFLKRAIAIKELANHDRADIARDLLNLGLLYQAIEEHQNAEMCFVRALALQQKVLAAGDTEVTNTIDALRDLYLEQDEYAYVEPANYAAILEPSKALGAASVRPFKQRRRHRVQ